MAVTNTTSRAVTEMTDAELLAAFNNGSIANECWNHKAHLRVAVLLAKQYALSDSIEQMRDGLRRVNQLHGAPNLLRRGYHETITVAFMRLVDELIQCDDSIANSHEFCDRFPVMLDKNLLLRFYSEDRLWNWDAKRRFVEPDLHPLDSAKLLDRAVA